LCSFKKKKIVCQPDGIKYIYPGGREEVVEFGGKEEYDALSH